jgi:hypothetical protein
MGSNSTLVVWEYQLWDMPCSMLLTLKT